MQLRLITGSMTALAVLCFGALTTDQARAGSLVPATGLVGPAAAPVGLMSAAVVAPEVYAMRGAPATTLEMRARRGRWARVSRGRAAAPRFAVGGSIASWEPKDAGAADALLQGFVRGYLNPSAALQAEVGYWSHTTDLVTVYTAGPGSNALGASGRLQDLPAGVSLLYFVGPQTRGGGRRGGGAALYGGIGVAWHTWKETYDPGYPGPASSDTRTAFGYHYIAGLELGRPNGAKLFGEYRYTVGRVDDLDGIPLKFDGSSIGGGIAVAF